MRTEYAIAAALFFMVGCVNQNVRSIEETPERPADYSALYFSSSNTGRVLVIAVLEHSATLGDRGLRVDGGAVLPEPLWLWPGWVRVTYACPDARESFFTTTIALSHRGKYFLHCADDGKLIASRAEP